MSDPDDTQPPVDAALAGMVMGAIRAKARFVAFVMAMAVGTFVWFAVDAGQPLWLVFIIGLFGAILIFFFVALVWFWLRFFSHFGRKNDHARD